YCDLSSMSGPTWRYPPNCIENSRINLEIGDCSSIEMARIYHSIYCDPFPNERAKRETCNLSEIRSWEIELSFRPLECQSNYLFPYAFKTWRDFGRCRISSKRLTLMDNDDRLQKCLRSLSM